MQVSVGGAPSASEVETIEFALDDFVQADPDYTNPDRVYTLGLTALVSKWRAHLGKMLAKMLAKHAAAVRHQLRHHLDPPPALHHRARAV